MNNGVLMNKLRDVIITIRAIIGRKIAKNVQKFESLSKHHQFRTIKFLLRYQKIRIIALMIDESHVLLVCPLFSSRLQKKFIIIDLHRQLHFRSR